MLDPIRLRRHLKTQFCGRYLIQWSQVDSTNRVLMDWLRAGSHPWPEGLTLAGSRQTAGRGQQSRLWHSPPGGLYLSVLLQPQSIHLVQSPLEQLTLALGWGIALQLKRFCALWGSDKADAIGVKWPNDLVVRGHKWAGILTQAQWQGAQLRGVVTGVGLNVNRIPTEGACLASLLGTPLDLTEVAAQVLQGIEIGYLVWQQAGLDPILTDYNGWLWHRDQQVHLPTEGASSFTSSFKGTVLGVAASANLRIQTQTGVQAFAPGSLSLGYADSDPGL